MIRNAPMPAAPLTLPPSLLRQPGPVMSGYDLRQRYWLAARLLDRLLGTATKPDRPLRLLEVGSNCLNLFPQIFHADWVKVTRCDLYEDLSADPDYVQILAGCPLPFEDNRFDAIVALEVLEHVAVEERGPFLAECLRVARLGVVLSCPDGRPDVEQAERIANDAYQARHGRPHPFLMEHEEFGLPREVDVCAQLREIGAPHAVFPNSPLDHWLGRMILDEVLAENPERGTLRLSSDGKPMIGGPRPYRKMYVAVKGFDSAAALEPLHGAWLEDLPLPSTAAEAPADSTCSAAAVLNRLTEDVTIVLQNLCRTHAEALEKLRAELNRVHRDQHLAEEALHATRREAEQRRLITMSTIRSYSESRFARLMRPLRRLKQWLRPSRFDAAALLPWNQLGQEAGPAQWQATGNDAQFVVPCHLPAGWVRVRVKLTSPEEDRPKKRHAELYADFGQSFHADSCLARYTWFRVLADDSYLFLPEPALAIRFDPLDAPGTFQIEEFQVESVTGPRAWLAALGRKRRLLRDYQCTLPAIGRGLKDLARGRVGPLRKKIFQGFHDARRLRAVGPSAADLYAEWREARALTDGDRAALRDEAVQMASAPVFSVIMPVCDPPLDCLRMAIDSVRKQTYPHWQLCIADDASRNPAVHELLRAEAAADPRIEVSFRSERGGISRASNEALSRAKGTFIALLDHDDELAEQALSLFAREVIAHPAVDFLYSDEDKIEPDGRHVDPFLKPDWSPEFFLTCMYTCHLGVYRTEMVRKVGGFRPEFDMAQDYDLALNVVAEIESTSPSAVATGAIAAPHAERIRHVPEVLYHWRKLPTSTATGHSAKPQAESVAREAVRAYLRTTGRDAVVEPGPTPGYHRVRARIVGRPSISIVIPTAGKEATIRGAASSYLGNCIESIRRLTTYHRYEIVVVDNGDLTPQLAAEVDGAGARRVRYQQEGSFNLAAKMNQGAAAATGDYLVILNDDIEVIAADWLEAMLEHAQDPGVGAVGAKLLFPDGRLQHVGVTLLEGRPGHPFYQFPGTYPGYYNGSLVPRNYSAVTGACMMVRADVYREVGGFDPGFPLNYNDVDFCLRVVASGKRIVWTPHAELYHFESVSKEGVYPRELEMFLKRWESVVPRDPFYHPLLTMHYHDYRLGEV